MSDEREEVNESVAKRQNYKQRIEHLHLDEWRKKGVDEIVDELTSEIQELHKQVSSILATSYVYVLANDSMPELYKIGMTDRTPDQRVIELNNATGVPTPFYIVFFQPCYNALVTEGRIHNELADDRVSTRREFFKADLSKICSVICHACDEDRKATEQELSKATKMQNKSQ